MIVVVSVSFRTRLKLGVDLPVIIVDLQSSKLFS